MPQVTCQFEKKDGQSISFTSEKSYLSSGLKNIFYELDLLNQTYKGSAMEYILAEEKSEFLDVRVSDSVRIIKNRF